MNKWVYTITAAILLVGAQSAFAQDSGQSEEANPASTDDAGPPKEPFENNNNAWLCEGDGFLPNHCINARSQGNTGNIIVFHPDPRGPQESVSTDPRADHRPCNHDDNADADGTWWEFIEGVFVCHHNGSQ